MAKNISPGNYRWRILSLLFFATTINYIDRQVIGILKPFIADDLGWGEAEYGYIVTAFQVAYAIGVAHPLSVNVETFGTGKIADDKIAELITEHFDLRPGAIIRDLRLRRPIYRATAAYGHFGRDDIDTPWENTDRAEAMKASAAEMTPALA